MDFFSSGFQSLFNDLEEDSLWDNSESSNLHFGTENSRNTVADPATDLLPGDFCQLNDCIDLEASDVNNNNNNNNSYNCDNYTFYSSNIEQPATTSEWIETILPTSEFPIDDILTSAEAIEAEWEEKFLDNYIEIPELIDFLPEKTILCNEMCDVFLSESSENLKLYRAETTTRMVDTARTTTSSSSSAGSLACTFGSCTKVYAKPAHLKAHLRRHLGEKPYVCTWPECTWKFSRSDELARHRRSHSGVKPYKCCYCSKSFARSDHLAKHRKVHERRLLAVSKIKGCPTSNIFKVRPGRKPKNLIASTTFT